MDSAITDVLGIRVGHYTDRVAGTGCTVVLCEDGAVAGVDVRGAAPGTRETDLLRPGNLVQQVQAILLSGGSAFGLDAASGVMRYLEERGYGYDMRFVKVPIVPAAILFDLGVGDSKVRPDAEAGYQACLAATEGPLEQGSVGAGTGATVGKVLGREWATKGGIGTASDTIGEGVIVGAIVAVNAMGEVVDPESGRILAGARSPEGGYRSTLEQLKRGLGRASRRPENTTIGVVATNAVLTKEEANRLAQMAQDGLAWAIRPVHTMGDGDTLFALSYPKSGEVRADLTALGAIASQVVARAIVNAVLNAESLFGIPAAKNWRHP